MLQSGFVLTCSFYTKCAVLAAHFVQLQFAAIRCHAPDPAAGANSAPQTSCLVFWERKERGKEKENKKGGKGNGGNGKKVKG